MALPGSGLSDDGLEEKFRELEEEVAVLVADVHDLSLFTKLNFTGFVKIVKKHDVSVSVPRFPFPRAKRTVTIVSGKYHDGATVDADASLCTRKSLAFRSRRHSIRSISKTTHSTGSTTTISLSNSQSCFDLVRTRGHPVEGDSSAGGSQNAFVRSTTKYWVSLAILRSLSTSLTLLRCITRTLVPLKLCHHEASARHGL